MEKDERELYFAQNIPLPETPKPAPGAKPWQATKVVGKPLPRVDAYERGSGNAVYPSDIIFPDMLFAAILRCPHAHAVVKNVDTREGREGCWRSGRSFRHNAGCGHPVALYAGNEDKTF